MVEKKDTGIQNHMEDIKLPENQELRENTGKKENASFREIGFVVSARF